VAFLFFPITPVMAFLSHIFLLFFSLGLLFLGEKERKAQGLAFGFKLTLRIPFAAAAFYR
jgi:hypothetical protein